MGFLDRLLGREPNGQQAQAPSGVPQQSSPASQAPAETQQAAPTDEQAVQRYEYLLRTAPPDQVERAHEEAFAQLTPAQRQQVLQKLAETSPQEAPRDDSPASLARSATRIEMQQPGSLRRAFGGAGGRAGMGVGGMLLGSIAGAFIGTAIAQELFADEPSAEGESGEGSDAGADTGSDAAGSDAGAGDFGGGDFGAGDFGGGDFGGGDFGGF